jgi:nucleoside-diphosphate-sugar epimerase
VVEGDALNPADVVKAAPGASLIVHAVNPPGYRNWAQWVLPMLESSISAARASGARILLPGTIYNYGPDAFPVLREDSPQNPQTRKGKIRAEMERRLRAAAVGNPNIAVHTFPWPLITLPSPFVTLFREMREMRYLWR